MDTLGTEALFDTIAKTREICAFKDHVGSYPEVHAVSCTKNFGLSELKLSITEACELI